MRTLWFILRKEFRQIFRDRAILRIIFVMPLMQLLFLPWAADFEMKNLKITVVDNDHSSYSKRLISKITSSGYFLLESYTSSYRDAVKDLEQDRSDLILQIPVAFEKNLIKDEENTLFIAANAINGVKANLGTAYLQTIIRDFNREVRVEWLQIPKFNNELKMEVTSSNWFNPLLNYKYYMVPGILVILITIVGSFLSSLNIVKEKEIGTIEQINVTPIKKYHFILGKLIPFWIIGLVILSLGFVVGRLVYNIHSAGSLFVIYVFAAVYLFAVLGLGLLVSTYTSTQQQAMLVSFFLMMVFILMGGVYTSIDSMPEWAQYLTKLNPVTYFVEVIRMVFLKGSGFTDILSHLVIICGFGAVFNLWAILNYHKRN